MVLVVLPLPSEHEVLFESAPDTGGDLRQVRQRTAVVLELEEFPEHRSLIVFDEDEFGEKIVVVDWTVGERVPETPRIAELAGVGHLQVVVVRLGEIEGRPEI